MAKISFETAEKIERRFNDLWAVKEKWVPKWTDIQKYLCPWRGIFDADPMKETTVDDATIINSSPTMALRTLASNLSAGINPPIRKWFRIGITNKTLEKIYAVKVWIAKIEEILGGILAKSNYYSEVGNLYEEVPAFGNGAMIVEEDFKEVIRCKSFTIGEYSFGLDKSGRVNAFGRKFYLPVITLVAEYGLDNVSSATKALYQNKNLETIIECNLLIEENDDRITDLKDARNKAFRSTHWESGKITSEGSLRISGYDEFPVLIPRWKRKNSSAIWGVGPGHDALGDAKMLQKLEVKKLLGLEKQVDPPLQQDASIEGDPSYLPGEVVKTTSVTPNSGVRAAYEVQIDINHVRLEIESVERRIDWVFFRPLFMMFSSDKTPARTATEIMERREEKQVLTQVLQGFKEDLNDPLFERVFNIANRAGLIPEPPDVLMDQEWQVEYISSLAQTQKMVGTSAIDQLMVFLANVAQVYPEIKDKADLDRAVEIYADYLGTDPEILRDEMEVEAMRQGRMQADQQQAQADNALAAIGGAKTLGDTPMGTNSALDNILKKSGVEVPTAPVQ